MRKISLSLLFLFFSMITHAYDVEIDGIYYNLTSKIKEAEVTYKDGHNCYKGDIVIPDSIVVDDVTYKVTSIGSGAFYWESITSIKLPKTLQTIGVQAFYFCKNINNFDLPEGLTTIKEQAFAGCVFKSIRVPETVTKIEQMAFMDCSLIEEVQMSSKISVFESFLFGRCHKLKKINLPNKLISIENDAFYYCDSLVSIEIPNNVSNIGSEAFAKCGIKTIKLPNSIKAINSSTFANCRQLKTVIIPKGVVSINSKAFSRCENLEKVVCYAETVPKAESDVFLDAYVEYSKLFVPVNSINNYRTTTPWNEFGTIANIDEADSEEKQCATPRIFYNNGMLSFECETEGVVFVSKITNNDIETKYEPNIELTLTYNICVYATKGGYKDSEKAYATLCWIDVEPKTEGIESSATSISARPILIQNNGGDLFIKGTGDDLITIYDLNGKKVAEEKSIDDNIVIKTNLKKGNIAILKVGERSIKILMR